MRDYNECRPYVDHLVAEHRRLHALLRQTRGSIVGSSSPDRDTSSEEVAAVLRRLREELAHHFTEEEEGGCLDEAVSRCPRLSPDVRRIETEHVDLLAKVDRMIVQAASCEASLPGRIELEREFDDFCRQIHAHEVAENDVLRQGFGVNVNGEENGQPTLMMDG